MDVSLPTIESLWTLLLLMQILGNQIEANKSHSPDGLTVEFFQSYWHLIRNEIT